MYSEKKQNLQVEENIQHTIKVDGTNVHNAARHYEKNMYKALKSRLNELKNKSGRPTPIPKGEKEDSKGRSR